MDIIYNIVHTTMSPVLIYIGCSRDRIKSSLNRVRQQKVVALLCYSKSGLCN